MVTIGRPGVLVGQGVMDGISPGSGVWVGVGLGSGVSGEGVA